MTVITADRVPNQASLPFPRYPKSGGDAVPDLPQNQTGAGFMPVASIVGIRNTISPCLAFLIIAFMLEDE